MGNTGAAMVLGTWLVAGIPGILGATGRQNAARHDQDTRIRTVDQPSAALLKEGLRLSPTLGALAGDIEESDVVVFVLLSSEPGVWRGKTQFQSAAGGRRFLRVTVSAALDPRERLAVLGHEFQHVLEVAAAPEVVDRDGMRRLFERQGHRVSPTADHYETREAQVIEQRVREEVARTPDSSCASCPSW